MVEKAAVDFEKKTADITLKEPATAESLKALTELDLKSGRKITGLAN